MVCKSHTGRNADSNNPNKKGGVVMTKPIVLGSSLNGPLSIKYKGGIVVRVWDGCPLFLPEYWTLTSEEQREVDSIMGEINHLKDKYRRDDSVSLLIKKEIEMLRDKVRITRGLLGLN